MNELLSLYQKVYGMLEDEESRDIYLNRLNGLISRDYRYIANVVKAYLPGLQVLNGKTIKDFQNLLPKDRKIVRGSPTWSRPARTASWPQAITGR